MKKIILAAALAALATPALARAPVPTYQTRDCGINSTFANYSDCRAAQDERRAERREDRTREDLREEQRQRERGADELERALGRRY